LIEPNFGHSAGFSKDEVKKNALNELEKY